MGSDDPWQRYWGLIVCSCFGQAAREFVPQARALAQDDSNLLVRTRAAEFLGLIGQGDPRPVIMGALAASESPAETLLILNSVVLLRDGGPSYEFMVTAESLNPRVREANEVQRRLEYLNSSHATE